MGLPVVTTEFMGCKEMVSEATGIKVAAGSPSELASALEHIMSMSETTLARMGNAGRSRLESLFSARRQDLTLSTLIESV